jgi:hypothetical protein
MHRLEGSSQGDGLVRHAQPLPEPGLERLPGGRRARRPLGPETFQTPTAVLGDGAALGTFRLESP